MGVNGLAMKNILLTIITLSILIDPFILSGQQYFKLLEVPENSYFQRLAQFSNGDILVGDAPKDILSGDSHRGYYLLRIDPCGNVLWANTYHFQGRHLTFDQFTIDDSDNIYTFGSALNGLKEEIYINKIAPDGQLIQERLYDAAIIDNVTYSIDYKEGRLAVFGFLFQSSIEKSTYVLMLDTNLNLIWQYLYDPFETYGEAIMTKDLGVLYYTRNKIVKVDSEGQVEWAREIEHDYALSLSIPVEVADGYVYAIYDAGIQFLIKIDTNGSLVWQSEPFSAYYHIANMEVLSDGRILAVYHYPMFDQNIPSYILLTPEGKIIMKRRLSIDFPIHSGFTYLTIFDNTHVHLLGNANMAFNENHNTTDFLLQFNLEQADTDCFEWEDYSDIVDQSFPVQLNPVNIQVQEVNFQIYDPGTFGQSSLEYILNDVCEGKATSTIIERDTLLECEENWLIQLPSADWEWQDGDTQPTRLLTIPETQIATKINCRDTTHLVFRLEKEACDCKLYIPNAFSPNQDGINDVLEIFPVCSLLEFELKIFDRWGALVFESTELTNHWDGTFKGEVAQLGVYVVYMKGLQMDAIGAISSFEVVQNLFLLR